VRIRSNYPIAHNNLAVSLAAVGKTDEAIEQFSQALRLDGGYEDAHCNLASVLLRVGRRDEAIAHLREAVRLKPDDVQVKAQLRQLGVEN
jgi:tetratricopeptide (TPR) repeat protein